MTTEELKNLANEAATVIAAIPALVPYTAPISLALSVAAAVAPPIYEEIKVLFGKSAAGEPLPETDIARLQFLIAALKSPDDYFNDGHDAGVASVTPPVAAPATAAAAVAVAPADQQPGYIA